MQSHMKPVREKLGGKKAADITEEMVTRYQRDRIDHVSKSTVNRECQLIGQALNKFAYPTIISRPIRIRKLAESPAREDFFEPGEVESVIVFLPDYLRDLVRFAWLSGWRKQECTTLTWDCVSFSSKEIRLKPQNSKNREGRILPMTPTLVSLMQRRIEDRIEECPYVFHRRGEFIRDFRKAWYTATKQASCTGRVFHALRRSSIRDRIRNGVHERVAMSISGHKTRSVFDLYNITNVKDMRDALLKTEKYQDQRRTEGKTVVSIQQGKMTIAYPAEEDPEDV